MSSLDHRLLEKDYKKYSGPVDLIKNYGSDINLIVKREG